MNIDFDPTVDHYKVLGVDPKASATDIKKAYRRLAKEFHPDSTGGDKKKETRFKEVSSAYEVLGDEKKRAQYDEVREGIRTGRYRRGPAAGGPAGSGPQVWDLSDLFGQFFSGQRQAQSGVHFEVEDWPFGEAAPGGRRQARRERRRAEHTPEPPVDRKARASDGSWLTVRGQDVHSDVRLPFQDAILGTVREIATIDGTSSVKIPPGTSSGQKLRLRGKGIGGKGDHYVTVHIDVPRTLDDDARKKLVDLVAHLVTAAKKSR